ncbi:MAG: NTP transferase domain-containing protein, partial [Myxococcales bacterium]|nr:NTP transferase domain-containing protein [Myxococcales bacterium]
GISAYLGIILAGGGSTRMGRPKALLPAGDGTFLSRLLVTLDVCPRRVVVAGAHVEPIRAYLRATPSSQGGLERGEIVVVENPDPDRGQFSSLQLGLTQRRGDERGAIITPCDVPLASTTLVPYLIATHQGDPRIGLVVPEYDGNSGHPALLDARLFEVLLASDPRAHTRRAIEAALRATGLGERRQGVDEPLVAVNINTIDDYQSWLRRDSDA